MDAVERPERARRCRLEPVDRALCRAGFAYGIALSWGDARVVYHQKWTAPGSPKPVCGACTVDAGDPWAYGCMLAVLRVLGIRRAVTLRPFTGC
jgi:hypothetical protein